MYIFNEYESTSMSIHDCNTYWGKAPSQRYSVCIHPILPTFNTLIRRRGHYNAWKLSTCSFSVRIEMLRLMNKMSAKILNFWIGWHKPLNFENATKCLNQSWWYLLKHVCFILKLKDFCNTCVHFQWKKTNACRHNRDTVSAAHAWFAWQAPSLGHIAYLR